MSTTTTEPSLRIGDVAKLAGTTPRRSAGTVPIIAAVLGLLNMPEPAPTISSHRPLCQ